MEKKAIQLRMPLELKEKIDEKSKRKGISINAFILSVLWKDLETKERR